jgi:hypothetical protein
MLPTNWLVLHVCGTWLNALLCLPMCLIIKSKLSAGITFLPYQAWKAVHIQHTVKHTLFRVT